MGFNKNGKNDKDLFSHHLICCVNNITIHMIKIKDKEFYTIKEVANILGMNQNYVSSLVKNGKLKSFKVNEKRHYFSNEMMADYLEGK